mgnify:FL=1
MEDKNYSQNYYVYNKQIIEMMNIKCHVYETNVSVCLTGLDNSLGWLIGPVDRLDRNCVGSDGSTCIWQTFSGHLCNKIEP